MIIPRRLRTEDIIIRAEAREESWLLWAGFWIVIGMILGTAGTLLLLWIGRTTL